MTFEAIGDKVAATAQLTLDIGGLPAMTITGPDDRLSGEAYAGQERSIPLTITNIGSAPVVDVGSARRRRKAGKSRSIPSACRPFRSAASRRSTCC